MSIKEKIKFGLERNHGINREWAQANLIDWDNVKKRIYDLRQEKMKIKYDKTRGYYLKRFNKA
jgi:hypothetical protein